MPPAALVVVRLCARLKLTTLVAQGTAALLLTPAVLSMSVAATVQAAVPPAADNTDAKAACFRNDSYRTLARLPRGLVAADIDFGPYILALTPHSAVAGPYHRMSEAIIATHRIFASPPAEARVLLARLGAAYVAVCGPRGPVGLDEQARGASLWGRLAAGAIPDWLEPLPADGRPFAIYRIRPAR